MSAVPTAPHGGSGAGEITEDALLGGRVMLRQPAKGYRTAIDPILLAAAVSARTGEHVLDLGCGTGAAAICLLARVPGVRATGLELQAHLARLAAANAELNGFAERFGVVEGDILRPPPALVAGSFDRVMMNPPYLAARANRPPNDPPRALATHENDAVLDDWLEAALTLLKPKGELSIIHRADRLDALLAGLRGKAGGVRVFPLWPAAGRPAKRVLVAARKATAGALVLGAGLVLHEGAGGFTPQAEAVLRGAAALDL